MPQIVKNLFLVSIILCFSMYSQAAGFTGQCKALVFDYLNPNQNQEGVDIGDEELLVTYFKMKAGFFVADNLEEMASALGYQKLLLDGFPNNCDWRVPYPYVLEFDEGNNRKYFASLLREKGFGNIKFYEKNKVITAEYMGVGLNENQCQVKEK